MSTTLRIADHPLLDAVAVISDLPAPLGECVTPDWLLALLGTEADAPLCSSDELRASVRDLLRHGGFKPTGRNKPSSEYLRKAHTDGRLGSINLVVDLCNAVSLHSGLPISVIDLDRAGSKLSIEIAPDDARYVFNPSGQEIDVGGLLCLGDENGPCANAVKDAQRTKTDSATCRTLSVIWGTNAAKDQVATAAEWYRELLALAGCKVAEVLRPVL